MENKEEISKRLHRLRNISEEYMKMAMGSLMDGDKGTIYSNKGLKYSDIMHAIVADIAEKHYKKS